MKSLDVGDKTGHRKCGETGNKYLVLLVISYTVRSVKNKTKHHLTSQISREHV